MNTTKKLICQRREAQTRFDLVWLSEKTNNTKLWPKDKPTVSLLPREKRKKAMDLWHWVSVCVCVCVCVGGCVPQWHICRETDRLLSSAVQREYSLLAQSICKLSTFTTPEEEGPGEIEPRNKSCSEPLPVCPPVEEKSRFPKVFGSGGNEEEEGEHSAQAHGRRAGHRQDFRLCILQGL